MHLTKVNKSGIQKNWKLLCRSRYLSMTRELLYRNNVNVNDNKIKR